MTDVLAPEREPTEPGGPPGTARRAEPRRKTGGWFRAVWRWHFFASFLVVPVLLVLATTGLIYLFRFQLEPLLHQDLHRVDTSASGGIAQPYVSQVAAVEQAYPGSTPVSLAEPREHGDPTIVSITTADGAGRDVFVDPYQVAVLGSLDPDTTLSGYAIRLHGELLAGPWGDHVIELGACWAVVMALTGYYLFVRGFRARRRAAKDARNGARLRDRHGLVGAFVGVGLLTLLVTGLPWTGFWGEKVQTFATERGSSMWSTDPGALSDPTSTLDESLPHSHQQDVPWAQADSEIPQSAPPEGERSVANVDTALAVAEQQGLRHPMTVALPAPDDTTGVFSVIGDAFDAPSDEKTVHVGRYGGEVVSTYGFDDYPLLAKVVSQGIGLHEGRSLGLWSFWGAALMCLAVIFMCITGPLMWWRRRPRTAARMGAPRGRLPVRATPLLAVAMVALALFLPIFGISLLAVLMLDQLVLRRVPALSRWFDTA
jgi:uncharacterized iron-regulated membrane protein